MAFAQRRNRLKTHFSERIPVVKRRMTVMTGWLRRNSSVSWGDPRHRTDRVDSHKSSRNQSLSVTGQVGPSPLTSISNRVQLNKHLIRSNMHYARRISRSQACTHVGNPQCYNPNAAASSGWSCGCCPSASEPPR
jgi:hypothetical protein